MEFLIEPGFKLNTQTIRSKPTKKIFMFDSVKFPPINLQN